MAKTNGKRTLGAGHGGGKRGGKPSSGSHTTYLGDLKGWNWAFVAEQAGPAVAASMPLPDEEEEAAALAEAQAAAAAGAAGRDWVSDAAKATAEVVHDASRHFRRRVREAQKAESFTMESWGREVGAWLNVERYSRLAAYWNRVAALMQAERGDDA